MRVACFLAMICTRLQSPTAGKPEGRACAGAYPKNSTDGALTFP